MTQFPMSPEPARRVRPAVVTASSGLLVLVVVLMLINVVLGIVANNDEVKEATKEFTDLQEGGISSGLQQGVSYAATAIFALIFLVLAALNLRGNRVSRIITWIFGGVGAVCCACSVISQGAMGALLGATGEDVKDAYDRLTGAYPSWYMPATIALSILTILALVTALILLALPAANAYFRKAQPEWTPPPQM
ncbi:MAG: hypothetical protein H0T78_06225 [Longispora sp.]|nr:hypothetical protein [Longispora sp. (in: high G+C Gram-positive bacteria)]